MTSLQPPNSRRERLLALGAAGSGKTSAWLSIAERCPDSHFYCIDTDLAVDAMLEGRNLSNVTHQFVTEWGEYRTLVDEYVVKANPGDWLIVDFMSSAWEAVQRWYTEATKGKELADFFLESRIEKSGKKGGDLEGDTDWKTINAQYQRWEMGLLKANQAKVHIFATAPAKAIGDRDGAEIKALFGRHGVKPEGQKKLGHFAHTVLWLKEKRLGGWEMTTIKDRQRRMLENSPVASAEAGGFATSYLMSVAGWRPT